mgnify:CR=1 FL=1
MWNTGVVRTYGQYCPIARGAEIFAERWTPLILRELICGSRRFNDLRRGVPLMSPSLLSKRLRDLEDAGVLERNPAQEGEGSEYQLTPAGRELRPVIEALGLWGHRWVQRKIRRDELDPALLMWDVRRCVNPSALPADRRTVVQFELGGVPRKKALWWLVFDRGEVDLCLKTPGYAIDLRVFSQIRDLVNVWLGHVEPTDAIRTGSIRLEGSRAQVREFKNWFGPSLVAQLAQANALGG